MMMRSLIIRLHRVILIRSEIDFFGSPWYNFYCTDCRTNKNLRGYQYDKIPNKEIRPQ